MSLLWFFILLANARQSQSWLALGGPRRPQRCPVKGLRFSSPPPSSSSSSSLYLSSTSAAAVEEESSTTSATIANTNSQQQENVDEDKSAFVELTLPPTVLSPSVRQKIDDLVQERAHARWNGDYQRADALRQELDKLALCDAGNDDDNNNNSNDQSPLHPLYLGQERQDLQLLLQDIPRRLGGGTEWSVQLTIRAANSDHKGTTENPMENYNNEEEESPTLAGKWLRGRSPQSVLNLAHAVLGMRVSEAASTATASSSEQQQQSRSNGLLRQQLVHQAKTQLQDWHVVHQSLERAARTTWSDDDKSDNDHESHTDSMLLGNTDPEEAFTMTRRFENWVLVETHLRGRKAADAAFWFALAGIQDDDDEEDKYSDDDNYIGLYDCLTAVCVKELQRFGERPSCRVKDVMAIVDRLAAAGVLQSNHNNNDSNNDDYVSSSTLLKLKQVVSSILEVKEQEQHSLTAVKSVGEEEQEQQQPTKAFDKRFSLHSDSCSLMIWKFSTRQRKQKSFLEAAAKHWERETNTVSSSIRVTAEADNDMTIQHYDDSYSKYEWKKIFDDPSRPLVIDVGCGFGVSLLGLATTDEDNRTAGVESNLEQDWSRFNFLGADLSGLAIGYASNIANRWGLQGKLAFVPDDALSVMRAVYESYPGPVAFVLIQFPTPYRLTSPKSTEIEDSNENIVPVGNTQLPSSATDGFMVTKELLETAGQLLGQKHILSNTEETTVEPGHLCLLSNCEDVAIYMRETCLDLDLFQVLEPDVYQSMESIESLTPTQRSVSWIEMGGNRAIGPGWWTTPILPRRGHTETEVACTLNGTPVHRCVLVGKTPSK